MKLPSFKSLASVAGIAGLCVATTAQAGYLSDLVSSNHLIATFAFDGNFTFYGPDGSIAGDSNNPSPPITGTIKLDAVTFGGTAEMAGNFLNAPFTANGVLSAQTDILDFGDCAGFLMCANSAIDFKYLGFNIPVKASFGMDPIGPFTRNIGTWDLGIEFDVSSIDRDGDGIPGTAIESGIFAGFTPAFTGLATLTKLSLSQALPNPHLVTAAVPEPGEWALLLAGLGLIAFKVGHKRQLAG